MKTFKVYRNIRREANIIGLLMPYLAIQCLISLGSLIVIIFSFGFGGLLVLITINLLLYFVLLQLSQGKLNLTFSRIPSLISNKRSTSCEDESQL